MDFSKDISAKTTEIAIEIARNKIIGSMPFGAYGKLIAGAAVTDRVVWADGVWSAPPSTGVQINVASSSANDTALGTGIRTIDIHYLDANLDEQIETVTLNGSTAVPTTATDIRFIQCAHMLTYGTSKKAEGIITFKNATTAAIYNQIDAGAIRCSSSARMVPKGKRAMIFGLVGSSISGSAQTSALISIASTHFDGHDFTEDSILMPFASIGVQDSGLAYTSPVPFPFAEGSIIAMTCSTDKAATVTGNWFGWLENDV